MEADNPRRKRRLLLNPMLVRLGYPPVIISRIVPLAALASDEFPIAALRQAAQRGRLGAIHGSDGVRRSSHKTVDQYRHTEGERRR